MPHQERCFSAFIRLKLYHARRDDMFERTVQFVPQYPNGRQAMTMLWPAMLPSVYVLVSFSPPRSVLCSASSIAAAANSSFRSAQIQPTVQSPYKSIIKIWLLLYSHTSSLYLFSALAIISSQTALSRRLLPSRVIVYQSNTPKATITRLDEAPYIMSPRAGNQSSNTNIPASATQSRVKHFNQVQQYKEIH